MKYMLIVNDKNDLKRRETYIKNFKRFQKLIVKVPD